MSNELEVAFIGEGGDEGYIVIGTHRKQQGNLFLKSFLRDTLGLSEQDMEDYYPLLPEKTHVPLDWDAGERFKFTDQGVPALRYDY